MEEITSHPILEISEKKEVSFSFDGRKLTGYEGMVISSALFLNKIKVFGHHVKDSSPQGIFCANGQCSQCNVIVNGVSVKACMTNLKKGMIIESCNGLPELPAINIPISFRDPKILSTEVLVIGAGPAGLSATKILGENNINVLLIDDKNLVGGKLVLQTHKFFGSQEDVYAGKRGIDIAKILGNSVLTLKSVKVWLNSVCLAIFSDGLIGILKDNKEYILIHPKNLLIATGAREKMLIFPGNTLPGVYGAGAFQTLVNRDLIKVAEKIFIVGGGNVGLIAGYHALQAKIEVVGLVEALPQCGGYKVHEDKLRRLGVPIYTSYTIISANGDKKVVSITIGQIDLKGKLIPDTEKTYYCDTILIAAGLNPVNEFYYKAKEFGFKVWSAGDAQEIAEASAAIFTGKIEALKILENIGKHLHENIGELQEFANLMKKKPPKPVKTGQIKFKEEGIYPVFYCTQEIPCNPCTSVCEQEQIETIDDLITQLPFFKGDKDCIGCNKCVAVCPGLAVVLIDYRKDKANPLVTFPFELTKEKLEKGKKLYVVSNESELGQFEVYRSRILKEYPKTQLISIKLPSEIAKQAVAIKLHEVKYNLPTELYQKSTKDEIIVCRCERVSVGEIRNWIRSGVRDFNELKDLTKIGMGSCGGKTCTPLIETIFLEEGVTITELIPGTKRPLFIEVPMRIFANLKENKEEL